MGFEKTAAGQAMDMKRRLPCAVSIKRYRQAVREGKAPPRFPLYQKSSIITYRNVDGDCTMTFYFKTPPEALAFAKQWGEIMDQMTPPSRWSSSRRR